MDSPAFLVGHTETLLIELIPPAITYRFRAGFTLIKIDNRLRQSVNYGVGFGNLFSGFLEFDHLCACIYVSYFTWGLLPGV